MTPPHNSCFDVVIIGAGPAGTTCAALLARRGVNVLLCDKTTFPRDKICGDCINPGCWDFFRLLGVEDEVAANAELVKGVEIAGTSGKVLDIPFENTLTRTRREPFIAMKRSVLDSLLLRRAVSDGATFCDATFVESIVCRRSDRDSWQIRLRKKDSGETLDVSCRTLIGADGRNSRVARLLSGIDDENDGVNGVSSDRIGVQFAVKRANPNASCVVMFFFPGGYGGIVGVTPDEANVAMVVTPSLARLAVADVGNFIAMTIHSNPHSRKAAPGVEILGEIHTAFPITPRINRRKYTSAYLVGDARHTTEPFTGEGVFFAMQDGIRAGQKLMKSFGLADERVSISTQNRFWRDKIFYPVLQRESITERLLAIGLRHKGLVKLASNMVFR